MNSGEHLANVQSELPFKSDEPHHKLIITDKHPLQYVQYATSTAGSITSTDTLGPSSAEFEVRFVSVKATWAIVWACPRRALTPSHLQRIDVNDAAAAADDHLITAKFSAAAASFVLAVGCCSLAFPTVVLFWLCALSNHP